MPLIPPETLEQIAAANDIVEVIGSYFPLKRAGATYKAICPFHQEKTPSFNVNPHRQIYKCFGCGAGGGVIRFVMEYEHLNFNAAAKKLAERAGIRIIEEELSPEDTARISMRRRLLALHADAANWFHLQLLKKPAAKVARDYLKSRDITVEIAKGWRLGYAPDSWDAFAGWAASRGYRTDEIVESGLVKLKDENNPAGEFYDRFRHRIMFPICNDTGEVIAFSGRVLESDPKAAKYVNSPETILFKKSHVLFGLDRSKRALIDKKSAIVCEGQLDLITAFEAGVQNVIAPQGTAFTEQQAHILKRFVEEVVLCFDADNAGQKAAERSLTILLAESLAVRVAEMPPGEDPDSLIRKEGSDAFLARIAEAKDFFEFQLDRVSAQPEFATPKGRAAAARKLAGWLTLVEDPVLREATLNRISVRMEVSPQEFAKLLRKAPQSRGPAAAEESASEGSAPLQMDPTLRLMTLSILHDAEARAWLRAAPWRELFSREPDTGLIAKILESNVEPDQPAAFSAFMATLDSAEEAAVSGLLEEKWSAHALTMISDCWNEIARRQIRRRIDTATARLRTPGLEIGDMLNLQKEIVDLQKRLLNIARPLSPPL